MVQALVLFVLVGGARAATNPAQASLQSAVPQVKPATSPAADSLPAGVAAKAIQQAADAKKYLFIFFYKAEDDATKSARKSFEEAMPKLAEKAEAVVVNADDQAESEVVNRFELGQAPMPLVLAIGPSGAITRNFTQNFDEQQLRTAFISPGTEKSLKAIQDRKMIFISVQNGTTQHNEEAMQGVREFAADKEYGQKTEVFTLDPQDPAEADFLKQLQVNPQTKEAITVFLAPPGTTVGTYTGATQKDVLVAAAKKAAAGCNKPGCCPKKKP
jgi:hypothetical protein